MNLLGSLSGILGQQGSAIHVSSDGNDANTGGIADPFATLAAAYAAAPSGGTIVMERDSVFRETFTISKLLTVGVYGAGADPIVTGFDVASLTQETAGAEQAGGLADADFDDGTLNETTALFAHGATITASTDVARSGTYSAKFVGNGTDNRGMRGMAFTEQAADTSQRYFYAVYVAAGQLKNSSEWRTVRLRTETTDKVFFSLNTNASGNVATLTVTGNGTNCGGVMLSAVAATGFTMGAWNTVEVEYIRSATVGGARAWINGTLVGASAMNANTSGGNVNTIGFGNDAYGTGQVSGGAVYFDDVKVNATAISQALQTTDARKWAGSFTTEPDQVFVGAARALRVATVGEVSAPQRWHWAANTLTVMASSTSGATVTECSVRDYAIAIASNGVTVEGCVADGAGITGIDLAAADDVTLRDVTAQRCRVEGIRAGATTGYDRLEMYDITVNDCGGTGIQLVGPMLDFVLDGFTVSNCCRLHETLLEGHARLQWSGGVKLWGQEVSGAVDGFAIRNGTVSGCAPQFTDGTTPNLRGVGVWIDHCVDSLGLPIVENVLVDGCPSKGIYLEKTDDWTVRNCRVINSSTYAFSGCIQVEANNAPNGDSSGNLVDRCTVWGGEWGLVLNRSGYGQIRNNTFRSCISDGSTIVRFYAPATASNDTTNSSGNAVEYCIFGVDGSNRYYWAGVGYDTLAEFEALDALLDNNIAGDPNLVDPPTDLTPDVGSPAIAAGPGGTEIGWRA